MQLLKPEQIDLIYRVTDGLQLHRNWVAVPLKAVRTGRESVLPDGRVVIEVPAGVDFDAWLADLPARLQALDLSRTPRQVEQDPPLVNTPERPEMGSGPRRYLPVHGAQRRSWRGCIIPPKRTA